MLLRQAQLVILDELNSVNSLNLTVDNVDFTNVRTPETLDELFFAEGRNSAVTLVAKQGAPGLGKATIYYNRVDIRTMFADYGNEEGAEYITVPIDMDNCIISKDIIPAFVHYYGISITPDDVEPYLIDKQNSVVKLRFEPHALGFTGEILVKLEPGGALLPPNFPNNRLESAYEYPYFNTKIGQGSVYSYGYNFDDYAEELKKAGTEISMIRLAKILSNVTGHPWDVFRLPSEYNINEAKVLYNGPNDLKFKSNPLAENVMIVELPLYCINFGGQMILHYADPA